MSVIVFEDNTIKNNIKRIQSQVFSLLPKREEELDWIKPLETLNIELTGMSQYYPDSEELLSVTCKLRGMQELGEEMDFTLFRRSIFECCGLLDKIYNLK